MLFRFAVYYWKLVLYTEPCSKDGGPKKELSKWSSSALKEGTSFAIPAAFQYEVGMRLDNIVEKENGDDENYEEPYSVNSKPDSVLDGLDIGLSTLQVEDATTSRQQGTRVDETQENQSFVTDSDDYDGVWNNLF